MVSDRTSEMQASIAVAVGGVKLDFRVAVVAVEGGQDTRTTNLASTAFVLASLASLGRDTCKPAVGEAEWRRKTGLRIAAKKHAARCQTACHAPDIPHTVGL